MLPVSQIESEYKRKLVHPDEAVKVVKSGDKVYLGLAHGAVVDLDEALARRISELKDLDLYSTLPLRPTPFACYTASRGNSSIRFHCTHFGGAERKVAKDGRLWYVPQQFRELPKYWRENIEAFDVVMFRVGPMDRFGNFNIGPQVSDVWGAMERAKIVIVEVLENMPYAHGHEVSLNLGDVDYVVHSSNPKLLQLPNTEATEVDQKIAAHIVKLIESGSTLQLGIGGLPNTIGSLLCESGIQDLSVHTEMLADSFVDLYNAGKITGNKATDKGKMVYTFCCGSQKLYDFIDHNPVCCTGPVDYVNGIETLAKIEKLISINSCIQVDLFGQVSSESVGLRQISGTGGQLDYVFGGFLSKGGKSFLCTPSTQEMPDGSLESRILPTLPQGTTVTTPRSAVHYIVTEYGAVNLKGRSTAERAELLVSIAHPQFREELKQKAIEMGIWK
ncbi:butyryl-CoA:acetate CoA-transferase [Desulfococcaceae bacterium OttesenSCG-928-F15]|nr:butyryl-CoA:acetate CoA-transferase [Desulfococcaceae bacterium OttesenSCG-928-F15]